MKKWCEHLKNTFHRDDIWGDEWYYRMWDGEKFCRANDKWQFCPICGTKRPTTKQPKKGK